MPQNLLGFNSTYLGLDHTIKEFEKSTVTPDHSVHKCKLKYRKKKRKKNEGEEKRPHGI